MDYKKFLADPRNGDTLWWRDEHTGNVVTFCPDCNVEVHHTPTELLNFRFEHKPWCPSARTRLGVWFTGRN
jgi:hypothetical protein